MLRIAVTGKPGVGKSTVVARAVEKPDLKACGIRTAEILVNGKRQGFSILGKYHVNLADLDGIGAESIKKSLDCDIVVLDEIGPMELKSENFIQAVEDALDSDRPILAVLHRSSEHSLPQRIREEFEVLTVDEDNRDDLPERIAEMFR